MNENLVEFTEVVTENVAPVATEVAKKSGSLVKTVTVFVSGVITGIGGTALFKKLTSKKTTDLPKRHFWNKKEEEEQQEDDFEEVGKEEFKEVETPEEKKAE